MRSLDTNIIFDSIDKALDFVKQKEQEALTADNRRQSPPSLIALHDSNLPPLILYPEAAYWNTAKEKDFIVTLLKSGRYSLKTNLQGKKFLFRGQTEFFDICKPSLFRKDKLRYTADLIQCQEMMLLMLSHPMVRLLDHKINLMGYDFTFEMNLYGLNQHYYNKTTFLDLSSDADVAAFFATNSYNPDTDIYSPVTDEDKIGVLYYYDIDSNNGFLFNGLSTIGLQVFPRSGCQSGFLLLIPKDANFNDNPRVKWVKFRHKAQVSEYYHKLFNGGKKLFSPDILEQHWKARNPNIVSDRSVLLNMIMNDHRESKSSVIKELASQGLSLRKYLLTFTPDELHHYYEDIRNGFWEDWCSRIYFNGDINAAFRNALISVVKDPQYEWAFAEGKSVNMPTNGFLSSKYKECLK